MRTADNHVAESQEPAKCCDRHTNNDVDGKAPPEEEVLSTTSCGAPLQAQAPDVQSETVSVFFKRDPLFPPSWKVAQLFAPPCQALI